MKVMRPTLELSFNGVSPNKLVEKPHVNVIKRLRIFS